MKKSVILMMLALLGAGPVWGKAEAQRFDQLETRVSQTESRLSRLEHQIRQNATQGLEILLFGVVCALWAQNTGRSGWLWFFLGMMFSFLTVLVLLWKNSNDIDRRRGVG